MKKQNKIKKSLLKRSLEKNYFRNFCAIIAIILTSVLFTSVFTVLFHLQDSFSQAEAKKNGWSAHAVITSVTEEQYNSLKKNSLVKEISYYIHYGYVINDNNELGIELRYDEAKMLEWNFFKLIEGKLPEKENEIMVSDSFFEEKQIPYGVNQTIELEYWMNGTTYKKDVVITGIYSMSNTQRECVFISNKMASELTNELLNVSESFDSEVGFRAVEVNFKSSNHLQEQLEQLIEESSCTAELNHYDVNSIYQINNNKSFIKLIAIIFILLFIGITGYLIIYNVFYISIRNDTRYYGELRTLGFTKAEIKWLIRREIYTIAWISIPIGILVGYVITRVLLPKVLSAFEVSISVSSTNITIFIFAAIFSFITVIISCSKPAKLAINMTAIEARKFNNDVTIPKSLGKKKVGSQLYMFAFKNLLREKKKARLIIISLFLSLMLMNLVFMITLGMNLDTFVKQMICTDFVISEQSYFDSSNIQLPDLSNNREFFNELQEKPEVIESGGALMQTIQHDLSKKALYKYNEIMTDDIVQASPMSKEIEQMKQGILPVDVDFYGLDSYLASKLEAREGTIDTELFQSGDYVVVGGVMESYDEASCYDVGDIMNITYPDGTSKNYTVMAIASMPNSISSGASSMAGFAAYIPSKDWIAHLDSDGYYMYCFDVDDQYENDWEVLLHDYTTNGDTNLAYKSKKTYGQEFDNLLYANILIGGSLAVIVGIISIVNYINVIATGIYSRKKEFAIMQSIGMMKKQLYRIVQLEGIYYIGIAFLGILTIGSGINYVIMRQISKVVFFINYNFTVLPLVIMLPGGLVLAFLVPTLTFYFMDKKQNMLERLRME